MRFLYGGFDKIKSYLDAIVAMNKALRQIAPPLPQYSGQPSAAHPEQSANTTDGHSPETLIAEAPSAEAASVQVPVEQVPPSLRSLYNLCFRILRSLVETGKMEKLKPSFAALEMWGISLFEPDVLALDELFAANPDRTARLRDMITKCFVHIAIAEGKRILVSVRPVLTTWLTENLLRKEERSRQKESSEKFDKLRKELMAMLGREPLIELATERCGQDPGSNTWQ